MLYSSGSTRVIYLLSFLTCEIECVRVINIISKGKGNNETLCGSTWHIEDNFFRF